MLTEGHVIAEQTVGPFLFGDALEVGHRTTRYTIVCSRVIGRDVECGACVMGLHHHVQGVVGETLDVVDAVEAVDFHLQRIGVAEGDAHLLEAAILGVGVCYLADVVDADGPDLFRAFEECEFVVGGEEHRRRRERGEAAYKYLLFHIAAVII